jgi:glycosyltransferase involved in cell wall biosynthesis
MRELISRVLGLPGGSAGLPRARESRSGRCRIGSVLLLSCGRTPTLDAYLLSRPDGCAGLPVRWLDMASVAPPSAVPDESCALIVVRHAPRRWLRWVEQHRERLGRVIYLMDDDIPAALQAGELPFGYALRTAWRYVLARPYLQRLCDETWVSTAELQRRYAASAPQLCEPAYVPAPATVEPERQRAYFYHGTWAHRREIEWLVPVVAQVQHELPDVGFEIIGPAAVERLFRGIPRVRVRAPMTWPEYLAYAGTARFEIGLAPCLDTPFNRARSHVKLFDITRLGAAGIYADLEPYNRKIIHGDNGWLCSNRQQDWSRAIVELFGNAPLRRAMQQRALQFCLHHQAAMPALG